jgi:hypothetical protein
LHSLLRRQLDKHLGEETAELRPLIDAVDAAYRGFDLDRGMLERSLDLSSRELLEANGELRGRFEATVAGLRDPGSVASLVYSSGEGLAVEHFEARLVLAPADEIVVIVRDVTVRREAEEAIRHPARATTSQLLGRRRRARPTRWSTEKRPAPVKISARKATRNSRAGSLLAQDSAAPEVNRT